MTSLLFDYSVLEAALKFKKADSIKVIDLAGELYREFTYSLWASTQAVDKLLKSEWMEHSEFKRFEGLFRREKATTNMKGFNHLTSIYQSAKNLSLSRRTIVIMENTKGERDKFHMNGRTMILTPVQFLESYKGAKEEFDKSYCTDIEDVLWIHILRKHIC